MAKVNPTPELIQTYVDCVLGYWAGNLGFDPKAMTELDDLGLDQADVLFVTETGAVSSLSKEEAHGTIFQIAGSTLDGERVSVTVSFNPHVEGLCVRSVARL
jgi:hypothetical protein